MKPKYTTLTELSKAFKSGELDDSYYLMVDKGGASLSLCCSMRDGQSEEEHDDENDDLWKIFDREYGCPVEELLDLIGIPSEEA